MPPTVAKDNRLAVRLDPATHEALQRLANQNNRTLTGQVRELLNLRPRPPVYVFHFDDWDVQVFQCKHRFFVHVPSHLEEGEGKLFREALATLEEHSGWRHWGRVFPGDEGRSSLLGALYCDCEYAHIFVAMNLPLLERYSKGEWTSFMSPGHCIQYAMIQGATGGDYLEGAEVLGAPSLLDLFEEAP